MRPIWHARQDRIRVHLFLAVPAYHAVHLQPHRLDAKVRHDGWQTIRHKLANWMRLTTTLVTAGGEASSAARTSVWTWKRAHWPERSAFSRNYTGSGPARLWTEIAAGRNKM